MARKIRILETTIRDGGYMVDYHDSRSDIAVLVGGLDRAGLPFIEVGHGNGVGSQFFHPSIRSKVWPEFGDADHAQVALRVAKQSKVGVIFTCGEIFVPMEYLDTIAKMGFAFVRLAFMPNGFDDLALKYVVRAKELGMTVAVNLTQTYARTVPDVAEIARRAADHGADWFYVVDSSGGMAADDIKRYVAAVIERAPIEVGLHAHNNLGCAVANALAAVEVGASLVDATLNGIGRATGNPPTEQLAVALLERGYEIGIDVDGLVGLGRAVRSLMEEAGNDPFDVVSGGLLVHSRNVREVLGAAKKRRRSSSAFLMEVGRSARDRGIISDSFYPDDFYDAVAERTPLARELEPTDDVVAVVQKEILDSWEAAGVHTLEDLLRRRHQHHKPSAVHLSREAARFTDRPVPWEDALVGVTLPWRDALEAIDPSRVPDYLFLDEDAQAPFAPRLATFRLPFAELYARAARDLAVSLRSLGAELVCAAGSEGAARELLGGLAIAGASTTRPPGAIALIAGQEGAPLDLLRPGDFLLLLASWPAGRIDAALAQGAKVVRPHWRSALARTASSLVALRSDVEAADLDAPLVSDVMVTRPGQALWDRERAALIQADDPAASARRAAQEYVRTLWHGLRRF